MQTDIRLPIGIMFSLIGSIILIYGFATRGADMYRHSLGINLNIWTGAGLLVFGGLMLFFGLRSKS
jgi:hypothetical protein